MPHLTTGNAWVALLRILDAVDPCSANIIGLRTSTATAYYI